MNGDRNHLIVARAGAPRRRAGRTRNPDSPAGEAAASGAWVLAWLRLELSLPSCLSLP